MANQDQVDILQQGVEVWNRWREENREIEVDLRGADFTGADLAGTDLRSVDLVRASLRWADLRRADLRGAKLGDTSLLMAILEDANFEGAIVGNTDFGRVDLSRVKGLEAVEHFRPSEIGIFTLVLSKGKIPMEFLRSCGVPEPFIENIPSLLGAMKPIDFYSCFLSYSNKDQAFAERFYRDLQKEGIRCWFAPHDMKIGDKIRLRIDESIRVHDKLLLVLSKHSVTSHWVEHEVETAIGKELEGKSNVLFPIRLDDAVMESTTGWAAHIRLTRHIGDFTNWKNHDAYQEAFNRLLRDLKAASIEIG